MIDIHCHILPDFDDGSNSLEESIAMARMAYASGVRGIVATPHFPGEVASLKQVPVLLSRYEKLTQTLEALKIPVPIYLGAEILCLPETPRLAAKQALPTIGNTSYLLTEFYFNETEAFMTRMLETLQDTGCRPVVAHPERYAAVQHNPWLIEKWFQQGIVLQVNKGSILGAFGPKTQQCAIRILDEGLAHLVASDAHGSTRRTPHMEALQQWLLRNCSARYVHVLTKENPRRLLQDQDMAPTMLSL